MAVSLKHTTQAVGTDAGNGEIGKTQWNEEHTLTMAAGKLLGRSTAGTGAAEEITVGSGLTLNAGTLTAAGTVGGSDTQVQFNDGSAFGGDAGLTYNKTTNALTIASGSLNFGGSSSGTVTIQPAAAAGTYTLTLPTDDGTANQVLTTDGSGVLSWSTPTSGGTPGGSNTQLQYNNSGSFAGASGITTDGTSLTITGGSLTMTGNISAETWGTSGLRHKSVTATLTDTSAAGTVAAAYTNVYGGNTIAASNARTFTDYYTTFINPPTAGTNVTFTRNWALGLGGNLRVGGSSTLAGGTITADAPVIDASQTWNAGAVTFTGLKLNVTDTASAAASLLADFQVGGSTKFSVNKSGLLRTTVGNNNLHYEVGTTGTGIGNYFGTLGLFSNGTLIAVAQNSGFRVHTGTLTVGSSDDLILRRRGAANLALGAADAAAPVAQTLSVQSVVAGTTNTAGANLTITGSQGTGTGAGGSIIFQVAPAGSSGTAQNALATALTIAASKVITVADTYDLAFSTSTGTKIGTATTQKLSFYNATPVVQPTAVADATDAATVITQLNALLSRMRTLGLIAT